jgi:hypothetical protein
VVVLAEVVSLGKGRVITAERQTDAGVRTRLVELRTVKTIVGAQSPRVLLEEEAALLDCTPVVVDGVQPARVGDRGVFFLVAGRTDAAPYHALVGPQGRFLVHGERLVPAVADRLTTRLAAGGGPRLVAAIAGVAALQGHDMSGSRP